VNLPEGRAAASREREVGSHGDRRIPSARARNPAPMDHVEARADTSVIGL
jgi:hypothetical protein